MYLTHQLEGEHGLVSVGEVGVHGHDDAVGDDREYDAVLEGAAVDEPLHQPPDGVGGFEYEQAANKRDITSAVKRSIGFTLGPLLVESSY